MKIYLAGPMTGIPNFNFPKFDRVSAELRANGYEVVSPAELDSPEFRASVMADGITGNEKRLTGLWGDCLARDVKLIADDGIEAIFLLEDWNKSRGARLEATVGLLCNLKFFLYADDGTYNLPRGWVAQQIAETFT